VGGPDRPLPQKAPAPARSGSEDAAGSVGTAAAGIAAGAAAAQTSIYNRLTSAVGERGYVTFFDWQQVQQLILLYYRQILGDLEERFNSLEEGSRNMVAQVCG